MAQTRQFTLLLLYEKVASSLPVAQALKEKDIDVLVVQNAGELIQSIAARKTDMVGLSVNHTSTPSLIRVLKEKTQVQIMVFGEDKTPVTGKKLDKAEVDLKISGVANGYNIFMKIGHLVKKKEKETEHARSILLTGGGEKTVTNKKKRAGAFIVKGKAKDKKKDDEENDNISVTSVKETAGSDGSDQEDDSDLASQLEAATKKKPTSEEIEGGTIVFEDGIKENNGAIKQKMGLGGKKNPGALIFRKKDKDDAKKPGRLIKKDNKPKPLGVGGTIVFSDEALAQQKKFEKQESNDTSGTVEAIDDEAASTYKGKIQTPDMDSEDQSSGNVIDFQARKKRMGQQAEDTPVETPEKRYEKFREAKKKEVVPEAPVAPMDKLKHKKQFKEAVQRAGEKSFVKTDSKTHFGKTSKVCIVPVINPKEKGFLLFCSNDNQFLDNDGLQKFKLSLLDEMKHDAVGDFILGESFNIETFDVDISDWAERAGQFSYHFQSNDASKEIFVCFVKRDEIYPDFKKTEEPAGVYRVHIHTMPPLTPVNFNVYLYFIKNRRLICYLKKGGKFTARQIQRLYKRGFKYLYINEGERNEFLSFYLTLMINQDFQSVAEKKLA